MTCGASNTSFGLPGRAHARRRRSSSIAASHGLTSAIMDARSEEIVEAVRATDFLLGHDEWGATWIAALPRQAGSRRRGGSDGVSADPVTSPEQRPAVDRVRLVFQQADGQVKEVRVPAGTTLFDGASWNGDRDRLDLRRPRHVQEVQGARRVGQAVAVGDRPARVLGRRAEGGLAARLPRAGRGGPRRRGAAAADAARRRRSSASGGT